MASVSLPLKNKFDPQFAIADSQGRATQSYRDYMIKLDALVSALAAGTLPAMVNAANDAAASAAGVSIGQLYRNGNALQVRLV